MVVNMKKNITVITVLLAVVLVLASLPFIVYLKVLPYAVSDERLIQFVEKTVKEYMKPFKNKEIDKIILGCTHYPVFTKLIWKELEGKVEIVDTGEKVAEYLEKLLKKYNLQNEQNNKKQEIYLTERQEKFKEIAEKLLGENIQIKDIEMY